MLKTILIRRLIRRRLRRSRKYYFKWHDAMFFGIVKHEREKGKVTQNLPFYCLEISENSDYRSSLRTHPFLLRSIFSVNKAKIPSLHPCIIIDNSRTMYRSIFSNQRSKNASIIDHPPSSFHPPHQSYTFSSTKKQKFHTIRKIYKIYLSFSLLFFIINKTLIRPIPNWRTLHNRGWITLAWDRFQGNWYRLRGINNASTRRQTEEAELGISCRPIPWPGLHTCRPQFANNIPARILLLPWRMSLESGPPSLDWFRGRVRSDSTSSISSTSVSWN